MPPPPPPPPPLLALLTAVAAATTATLAHSPTQQCPCPCDYAADPECTCRDLRQNISVAATKTPVYASYPLTYRQDFNGRPYEVGG